MDALLARSQAFDEVVGLVLTQPVLGPREQVAHTLCRVSIEHANSVRILAKKGHFTSAVALVRLQFEALVRAHWVVFCATEPQLQALTTELTDQSAKKANKLPMLSRMLEQLTANAPPEAVSPLTDIKAHHWQHLSSYVHGGLHAVNRHAGGYPAAMIIEVIKICNGILAVGCLLLARLSGKPVLVAHVGGQISAQHDIFPAPASE